MNRSKLSLLVAACLLSPTLASAQTFSHFETGSYLMYSVSGKSRIEFLPGANTNLKVPEAGIDIVLMNLRPVSDASGSSSDVVAAPSNQYVVWVHLSDTVSGETAILTFSGELNGYLNHSSAFLANTYHSPTSQRVSLGAFSYTVSMGPYTSPDAPGGTLGAIGAHVTAVPSQATLMQRATKSARIISGSIPASADDVTLLDIDKSGDSAGRIDLLDVVRWARKAAGLDA